MCPPASPPYHFPICTSSRFGTPACTRSAGFSIVCTSLPATFAPMTVQPSIRPNASCTLANLWSTIASSPWIAKRIVQRPKPSSEQMRSIASSGRTPSPWCQCARSVNTDAAATGLRIIG